MKKIKIVFIIFLLIGAIGVYDIMSNTFSVFGTNSSKVTAIKNKIKNTLFYLPSKIKKADELEKYVEILSEEKYNSTESILTLYNYSKKIDSFKLFKKNTEKISSKNNVKYEITYYDLPLLNYYNSKAKPVGYIEKFNENLIILSGDGQLYKFNESEIGSKTITLTKVQTNIQDFEFFKDIDQLGEISIRDIEIYDNKIYFSVITKNKNNCYNLEIYNAALEQADKLNFKIFYSIKECLTPEDYLEFNIGQSGGRIIFADQNLLFSTGAFRTRVKPQDEKSFYGKIIKINLRTLDAKILSKGHRNIQGLSKFKDIIVSTEHGPYGGDEVNVHKNLLNSDKILNYGWPISSYGTHYPNVVQYHKGKKTYSELINIAPLEKSHKDFGFIEPIKYFAPGGIGISEIEFSNKNFNSDFINDVYFGALRNNPSKYAKLYHLKFNKNFEKIIYEDEITIKKRIRDIKIPLNDKNMFLMLETTPTLGILQKVN